MNPSVRRSRSAFAIAATAFVVPAAHAQEAAPEVPGDIVVTAQRREQKLQEVPAAVTALVAAEIDDADIRSLDRIGAYVPNLYLARNFGTTSGALVFLRGVGEGDSIFTNDPPVGVYVDDVILPRATGALLDLIDVERLEVLRGPQGTLYGRNTSGGALKVVTRRPSFDRVGGVADLTLGTYRRVDARATLNLPLASDLAVRVSGISRNQRGWGRNLTDNAVVNGQSLHGGRIALLWEPSATLSIFATADKSIERSTPRFPQQFLADPAAPGRFTNDFATPGGDIDHFRSADTDPLNKTDTGGAMLRADLALGGATLSSITGYRSLRSRIGFDQTANAPGVGSNVILLQDQKQHSISQELQLAGSAFSGRVDLLAGLFYFNEHNAQLTAVSFASPAGTSGRFVTDDFFVAPSRGASPTGNWSPYRPMLDTDSVSAFASATARIGAHASVTAGLRYTDERKRYDVRFLTTPDTVLVLPDGRRAERLLSKRWNDLSPRLAADYRLEGQGWQALVYASAAKGFRSGSFDGRARNIDFVLNRQGAIAPESVWSYEGGIKSDWWGRRLTINLAYFVNDYTDIAFSAARANSSPPEIFRQNVGDARIQGLEAEWSLRPLSGIEVGGWVATLDDRFTRLKSSPGCTAFVRDERNLDLRFTPAFRYQLRGRLEQRMGQGRLHLGGDVSGASSYNIALCNEPQHRVTDATMANAQIGYDLDDWSFTLSATNLTDNRFNTGSVGTIGYPMEPRQVQFAVRRRF
ncbi:TonB-dependent receptor [Sphingomonas sp. HF-S4]|uniref:TonB-dependent receptor n=1 Tax=Sphingomonas agrestis TaxID=3080540 RepID=A0ABU3Y434_9SPHN|nr:TonB-dependent receptor [Sphingomonas sp. HF-S4]MDV3456026.1 TonB-dependent receptor [Sphingomonas sp. HF-S4]